MKFMGSFLFLSIVLMSFRVEVVNAFVKLVIFGTKVELKNNFKTFNVSYNFNNPKSLTNQSLDFDILLKRDLNDLKLVISYHVIALNNTMQNALLKRSIDICFFLRNPRSDRLIKSIFDYIKERSHLPSKCPMPAGTYYMHNLKLADMPLPGLLPETEFMVDLGYYSGIKKEITVSFQLYGKLVRIFENILPSV
ncbi:uncharacterized protein LOC128718501 [Anopheles marshallii]|uniref:uncharacterized protein LOC128718501 n=1 Tax=Anopheles marshallii TaxID=1521116 RepID=UPI00237AA45A|nr:uncharacterized protein LOC128718501 [Anopheles marshallii]